MDRHLLIFSAVLVQMATICAAQRLIGSLQVKYEVLDNIASDSVFDGNIILVYNGTSDYTGRDWQIYFTTVRLFEPDVLKTNPDVGSPLGDSGVNVTHVDGGFHTLRPNEDFRAFTPGQELVCPFQASDFSVSKTDIAPNWYLFENISGVADVELIASTVGEELRFVGEFDTEEKWKRSQADQYNPYTAATRFDINSANFPGDSSALPRAIIPTPKFLDLDPEEVIVITNAWLVYTPRADLDKEAQYLAAKLGINVSAELPPQNYILLDLNTTATETESYTLLVSDSPSVISIHGDSAAGVFYGSQTLLMLAANDQNRIPTGRVEDYPRFSYRGLMLDSARNFIDKDGLLKIIDIMSWYKLNKLQLRIADDEGWRVEIDGLPELLEVGSARCLDFTESTCILPQYGSLNDPEGHSYSKADYREILAYANDRHIQVIPEVDSPGHANAAIKSMEQRYRAYVDTDPEAARQYLLTEPGEETSYVSVQFFRRNSINPCLNSTYNFMQHIVQQLKLLHEDIQPLTTFHFGGDEVAPAAFDNMRACQELVNRSSDLQLTAESLQEYFVNNVADIVHSEGLHLSGWEDGLIKNGSVPYNRSDLPNDQVFAYSWQNVWEWGFGARTYNLANEGYKVIISHATHLYYDHPQEPDSLERGLYWATRFTDLHKTFTFNAYDIYENINNTVMGQPLTREEFCTSDNVCPPLQENKKNNILGLQGQMFSETIRTQEQVEGMVFPRIVALAERAWHQGAWEDLPDGDNRDEIQTQDWQEFVLGLTQFHFPRLDMEDLSYNLPPPGGRVTDSKLEANVLVEGLPLQYSIDGGEWQLYTEPVDVAGAGVIRLQSRTMNGLRSSRTVTLTMEPTSRGTVLQTYNSSSVTLSVAVVCLVLLKVHELLEKLFN